MIELFSELVSVQVSKVGDESSCSCGIDVLTKEAKKLFNFVPNYPCAISNNDDASLNCISKNFA